MCEIVDDGRDQLVVGRGTASQSPLGEVGEDALHKVHPRRADGHEVKPEARVGIQPGAHAGLGMGEGVVQHEVQIERLGELPVPWGRSCSDNGSEFRSQELKRAVERLQARRVFIHGGRPQSNG